MRLPRFIRWVVGSVLIATMIGGPSSLALADTTIDFTVSTLPYGAICSVTASAGGSVDVHRYSTGTATFWDAFHGSGPLTLVYNTTGEEGDRDCYSTASNTDFTNAAGTVTIVTARSLSITPSTGGFPVYVGQTTPSAFLTATDIPAGGTTFDLTWYLISNGPPNPDAPVGTYTSTMTITLSSTSI